MAEYYNVTTNIGDAEIARAIATNTKLNITHIAFGDGNGAVPTPSKTRTTLVKEVHRQAVTKYERHPTVANWIIIETIIPSNVGGFWVREMGVIADGKMISHGSHAPFEKVADPSGVSEYRLKFTQDIRDGNVVSITLDQSLIYATQAWVEENYIKRLEIVDNLTTDISNKPLSARQGKYLQDYKLNRAVRIPDNADLNSYQSQGSYFVDLDLSAQTIKNSPTKLSFTLQVDVTAGVIQRLTTYNGAGTQQFIRSYYVEWSGWQKIYSELNPQPTVDAIDNLTSSDAKRPLSANQGRLLNIAKFDKSGGILTGEININTGESSPIKTVINKAGAITTNAPESLASIIHAMSFGWYESEWQIGNVRSGSQETAGFGITLSNSNLRFLINANGASNYGTFYSVGKVTAPEFSGLLDGSIKAKDQRNVSPAQVGNARMGCYFASYSGIRYGNNNDSLYGDFLAFNGYHDVSGGRANGLFLDKTTHRIFHFQNNFGADNWGTPREIAYTDNQNFTGQNSFEHGIRVTPFSLGFKYLAKGIAGDNDTGWIGIGADQINSGFLELGTGDDGTEPIYVRQYNSGGLGDEVARATVKNELILLDANGDTQVANGLYAKAFSSKGGEAILQNITGRYLFVNAGNWGCFDVSRGAVPLSVQYGGTGNGQGIAPSASKLQVPRSINNVPFDGSQDITVRDDQKFYAVGISGESTSYPAWNSKSGVYQKTNDGDSSQVIHFYGGGSNPALQIMSRYSNGGLFYRTARDGLGFEKDFDRIVTETGGTAPLAAKLKVRRRINDGYFDGSDDINISAPMRFLGTVSGITINDALSDGFYYVASEGIANLYGYGVLEVRGQGSVIHQTYYAHQKNAYGSVAVRQSWGGAGNFTPWRSLDPKGALTLTGAVTGNASFDESGNISIPTNLQVGIGINQYPQDVKASRYSGVVYTNNTGNTITVIITASGSNNTALTHQVSGVQFINTNESLARTVTYHVPNGASYMCTANIILNWVELR